jgi:Ca2+-binding RTX toxin-like protein
MPILASDSVNPIAYVADSEIWSIKAGVHLVVSGPAAVASYTFVGNALLNQGQIVTRGDGVFFGGDGSQVVNGVDGHISAGRGVAISGAFSDVYNYGIITAATGVELAADSLYLSNAGEIDGSQVGVYVSSGDVVIENSGRVSGYITALRIGDGTSALIRNSGVIAGGVFTDSIGAVGSASVEIVNTGEMIGGIDLSLSASGSSVRNQGVITGAVLFGAGADVYEGQGGRIVGAVSGGGGLDWLRGGASEDELLGGNGVDTLQGGAGDDTLTGGAAGDRLNGGRGADVFVYTATSDSRGANTDVIRRWDAEDLIDLSAIDASPAAGVQSLLFGGQIAPADPLVAGRVHFYLQSQSTFVVADVTGDGVADLQIRIAEAVTLNAGDFIL